MCTTCGCAEGNLYIEGDEHNPHSAFRSAPFAPAARPALNITGVKTSNFTPSQTEEGDLHYGHGEAGTHAPGMSQRRMLEVEIDVLDKNNRLAARNLFTELREQGQMGGGQGAFIGGVHRIAARLDGHYQLVAGALSSDPGRALASDQWPRRPARTAVTTRWRGGSGGLWWISPMRRRNCWR